MPIYFPPVSTAPGSTAFHGIMSPPGAFVSTGLTYQVDANESLVNDEIVLVPFMPIRTISVDQISFYNTAAVGGEAKLLVYDADSNGGPDNRTFQSAVIDVSATSQKNVVVGLTFEAFTQYWIGLHNKIFTTSYRSNSLASMVIPWDNPDFFSAHRAISRSVPFANDGPTPWVVDPSESTGRAVAFFLRVT